MGRVLSARASHDTLMARVSPGRIHPVGGCTEKAAAALVWILKAYSATAAAVDEDGCDEDEADAEGAGASTAAHSCTVHFHRDDGELRVKRNGSASGRTETMALPP